MAAVLLAAHAACLLTSLGRHYVTVDESGHIPSGLSHWHTGSYCAYRTNPPLARMLAAVPLLGMRPVVSYGVLNDAPGHHCEGALAQQFAVKNTDRYLEFVFAARLAGVLWSVLGGCVVFLWARELFGAAGGLLSLGLWCFEPTILGHAQVVSSDVPGATAGVLATYLFWRYLKRPRVERAFVSGITLGVAQLTKFTLLVLYPVWAALFIVCIVIRRRAANQGEAAVPRCWHGALMVVLSLLVINMGYEFRHTCLPLGKLPFVSRTFAGELNGAPFGSRFAGTALGDLPVPLPADYLLGIDAQQGDFENIGAARGSYLNGTWREIGWWHYYLFAMAVKMPVGVILLIGGALIVTVLSIARRSADFAALCVWLPGLAILALVSSQTGFNHHFRYVLPAIPFFFIGVGTFGQFFRQNSRWVAAGAGALAVWAAGSSLAIHPHYLSYFNEAAGGPKRGPEYLVDSNIDWGQDLLFLRDWLRDHPEARPIHIAYFGANHDPTPYLAVNFSAPPPGHRDKIRDRPTTAVAEPYPGYFAISVNFVKGMPFYAADGQGKIRSVKAGEYSFFQRFQPIAMAGYSIYIYHVSLDDANRVRRELGLRELADAEATTALDARTGEADP